MATSLPLCGSVRIIEATVIECNRRYGHSPMQKHRAILEDGTLILWDGGYSTEIEPRTANG